ncbi:hypothetical protein [Paenibacillus sp. YN15]|uniref:hypothetical protein n=1 Tax=Paenibacillus sp. YN15 TaxID=1742774 RepID=UPI000DCECEF6|nr:hypothetical protein [Paenibacillus sp. YN15]RAV03535.1 hypothetical protein DQG13_07465 [Paenibacillus sp. YN15]
MAGNVKWNLVTGLIGFAGTLALSMPHNILKTAFIQSLYSFIFLFLITFLARWLLGLVAQSAQTPDSAAEAVSRELAREEDIRGTMIDLATPDDAPVLSQTEADTGFAPLNPPKLSTDLGERQVADAVKALRQMTDK